MPKPTAASSSRRAIDDGHAGHDGDWNHTDAAVLHGQRRRLLAGAGWLALAGSGLGLATLGSGCAGIPGGLNNFEITRDQINTALAGQFPLQRRMLDIFDITLSLPRLTLNVEKNRLDTEFDLAAVETLFTRKVFRGTLGFGSGVRYEPVDHSIRLAHVSLDRLTIPGVSEPVASNLQQVARIVAETLLESLSVYRMPQGVARLIDTLGTAPSELKVTSTGVAVAFKQIGA
jgi:hypothetical protein